MYQNKRALVRISSISQKSSCNTSQPKITSTLLPLFLPTINTCFSLGSRPQEVFKNIQLHFIYLVIYLMISIYFILYMYLILTIIYSINIWWKHKLWKHIIFYAYLRLHYILQFVLLFQTPCFGKRCVKYQTNDLQNFETSAM